MALSARGLVIQRLHVEIKFELHDLAARGRRAEHEDPEEYLHQQKNAVIN